MKTHKTDFGQFIFLDEHTVVAEANDGVNIDGIKVQYAINLIEKELLGDYAIILDRKSDYSVVPVEVYKFFSSLERLKGLAIVSYAYLIWNSLKYDRLFHYNGITSSSSVIAQTRSLAKR